MDFKLRNLSPTCSAVSAAFIPLGTFVPNLFRQMCVFFKKENFNLKREGKKKKTQNNAGQSSSDSCRKLVNPEPLSPYLDKSHGLDKHIGAAESKKERKVP